MVNQKGCSIKDKSWSLEYDILTDGHKCNMTDMGSSRFSSALRYKKKC